MTAMTDNLAPVQLEIVEYHGLQRDEDGWEHYAYDVRLSRGDESMRSPWKQGTGITDEPNAEDVLSSLIMDAQGFVHAPTFEDWAGEYGYDADSRKAFATYVKIGQLASALRDVLGDEDYAAAMSGEPEDEAKRLTEQD